MNVGFLKPLTNESGGEYVGRVDTLHLSLPIRLEPFSEPRKPQAPTHRVVARNGHGHVVEIGSAWLRTITRGDRAGEPFFSLTLDEPSMPHGLNVAAFRNAKDSGFTLSWRRRQSSGAKDASA
jgi:uncharacterized protein (DUF736 family)